MVYQTAVFYLHLILICLFFTTLSICILKSMLINERCSCVSERLGKNTSRRGLKICLG